MLGILLVTACHAPRATTAPPTEVRDAIYFVLVDRFANGDPSNDHAIDLDDPQAWHGGDIAGVTARLPYLEELGVGAVWLSPITASQHAKVDEWGAFHGYWLTDHRAVEPRFGDLGDARALSDALHERGMRLYLDTVWNHVGYDAPLLTTHPEWFHGLGDVQDWDDPVEAVTHDVHGLPDLAQEDPAVYAHLLGASQHWIREVAPDGFRIDAVRHLPSAFLSTIAAALRDEAGDAFALIGEHFEGDPHRLAARYRSDGFTAVFDFPMHYAMRDTFCADAPVGRLAATLAADRAYGVPRSAPGLTHLVTFLDNHDVPRVMSACGGDADRVARALAFMVTTRGTPCLYQGTEAGQSGAEEPHNRADMDFGAHHPLHATVRSLLDLRARHAVLREGVTRLEALDGRRLAYSRVIEGALARITVNLGDEPWTPPPPPPGLVAVEHLTVRHAGEGESTPGHAVPPDAVAVTVFDGPTSAILAALGHARQATVRARLVAEDIPASADDRVLLVGAGDTLGRWSPADGIRARRTAAGWRWDIDVPLGDVLALKLVLDGPAGTRWSPGPDRFLWVRDPRAVHSVSWGADP